MHNSRSAFSVLIMTVVKPLDDSGIFFHNWRISRSMLPQITVSQTFSLRDLNSRFFITACARSVGLTVHWTDTVKEMNRASRWSSQTSEHASIQTHGIEEPLQFWIRGMSWFWSDTDISWEATVDIRLWACDWFRLFDGMGSGWCGGGFGGNLCLEAFDKVLDTIRWHWTLERRTSTDIVRCSWALFLVFDFGNFVLHRKGFIRMLERVLIVVRMVDFGGEFLGVTVASVAFVLVWIVRKVDTTVYI